MRLTCVSWKAKADDMKSFEMDIRLGLQYLGIHTCHIYIYLNSANRKNIPLRAKTSGKILLEYLSASPHTNISNFWMRLDALA
jgi:hypothetical protein